MQMCAAIMTLLPLLQMLCTVDRITSRWQCDARYMSWVESGCLKLLKNSLLCD